VLHLGGDFNTRDLPLIVLARLAHYLTPTSAHVCGHVALGPRKEVE